MPFSQRIDSTSGSPSVQGFLGMSFAKVMQMWNQRSKEGIISMNTGMDAGETTNGIIAGSWFVGDNKRHRLYGVINQSVNKEPG